MVIDTKVLRGLVERAGKFSKKTTLPVTECVRLAHDGYGVVTVEGSDLECGYSETHALGEMLPDPEDAFNVCLNAKLFKDILGSLDGEKTHIKAMRSTRVEVRCGGYRGDLPAIEGAEFPPVRTLDAGLTNFEVTSWLQVICRTVACCASTDSNRATLTGILLEFTEQGLSGTATDGFRIGMCRSDMKGARPCRALIPAARVGVFDMITYPARVGVGAGMFVIQDERIFVKMSQIEGNYPDVKRIIPDSYSVAFGVNRDEARRAIKQVMIMSSDRSGRVVFDNDGDTMTVSCAGEAGNSESRVRTHGGAFKWCMNGHFLVDALDRLADEVDVRANAKDKPVVIDSKNNHDTTFIIMPLLAQL